MSLYSAVSVPYRGATFLNFKKHFYQKSGNPVSVPYRGATFLNYINVTICRKGTCFRPLSGSYISQLSEIIQTLEDRVLLEFPSPIGELHFSIYGKNIR